MTHQMNFRGISVRFCAVNANTSPSLADMHAPIPPATFFWDSSCAVCLPVFHARPLICCVHLLGTLPGRVRVSTGFAETSIPYQVLMYTAMKSIFEDKNNQEDLFFKGPGKDLDVRLCFVFWVKNIFDKWPRTHQQRQWFEALSLKYQWRRCRWQSFALCKSHVNLLLYLGNVFSRVPRA